MKKVKGLKNVITTVSGSRVIDENGIPITVKSIMVGSLEIAFSKDPVRAILVATKIHESKEDSVTLEDEDYRILKTAVESNERLTNIAKSPVIKALNSSGEEK